MDPLGAGSAVVGVLQVGLSLAKAIRKTVKDYKEAADDLTSLAQDIEKTLWLVSQLNRLIGDNEKTGMFSDGGVAELNRCLKSTEQIFDSLVALLTKTGVSHAPGTEIKSENLIISRSSRMKWPGQKSRVKDKQKELDKVRLELTVILLLKETLQADPNTSKAMQHMLIVAEKDLRTRPQAHRKKHGGSAQISQATPNAQNTTTPSAVPSTSETDEDGNQAVKSFAHQAEILARDPAADETWNTATVSSNRDDGEGDDKMISKTAIQNEAPENDPTGNTAEGNGNAVNDTKANGNATEGSVASSSASPANIANVGPIVVGSNPNSSPAKGPSSVGDHSETQIQPQSSRIAIIENFKQQIRADVIELSDKYQAMFERAIKGLGVNESEHDIRIFLESEHAREWSSMFGDWLPEARPKLTTPAHARKIAVRPSNFQRWFSAKLQRKHFDSSTPTSPRLSIPISACLLAVGREEGKPNILRLDPPKKLKRRDIERTGLIWCSFEDATKEAIWKSLQSDVTLPDGWQWNLYDAAEADPGPSRLTRSLLLLMSDVEYSPRMNDVHIVVFVASRGKPPRGHGFDHNEGDIAVGAAAPIFWRSVATSGTSETTDHSESVVSESEVSAMAEPPTCPPPPCSAGINQFRSEDDSPRDQPSSNSGVGSSSGTTRLSCHESRRSLSAKSEDTESSDQSDDSLDDDELYDQLLRKFTGHGLRERETGDERNDEYNERGADAQDDENADDDGTAHVSTHVEAGDPDKIIDGDDKSDSQNRDLHR